MQDKRFHKRGQQWLCLWKYRWHPWKGQCRCVIGMYATWKRKEHLIAPKPCTKNGFFCNGCKYMTYNIMSPCAFITIAFELDGFLTSRRLLFIFVGYHLHLKSIFLLPIYKWIECLYIYPLLSINVVNFGHWKIFRLIHKCNKPL